MTARSSLHSISRIYGEIGYWLAIIGIAIALIGCLIMLVSNYSNVSCVLNKLLNGDSPKSIQLYCSQGISYGLKNLPLISKPNINIQLLEDLGLILFGTAAIIGILITSVVMFKNRIMIYGIVSTALLLILLLSMLGFVTLYV